MKIGSKWIGNNGDIFEVDDIRVIDAETWVFYSNTSTMRSFSCLIGAFVDRFRQTL
jgi:hypothetical protein